jgi:hypothetical protein
VKPPASRYGLKKGLRGRFGMYVPPVIPYIRTLVFTLGFVAVAGIFWEVIR